MKNLQPGDILICISSSSVSVFSESDETICRVERDEHVTFIKHSDYYSKNKNMLSNINDFVWITILTTKHAVGDVEISSFKRAFE